MQKTTAMFSKRVMTRFAFFLAIFITAYSAQAFAVTAKPTFSPTGGTFTSAQTVTISDSTSGASINYTTDGSTPTTTSGTLYTGPITISTTTTLQAIAWTGGGSTKSSVASDTYTITGGGGTTVHTPTFSPAPGSFTSAQTVTISDSTSGASIRYTTDGTTPTETHGTLYSAAVTISATTTLNAIAYKNGNTDSSVATGTYTISSGSGVTVKTPKFIPAAGTFSSAQTVTISDSTSGASIRYTTDGSTPTETHGILYTAPVTISATATLNAIAYESGDTDSNIKTGTYTINGGSGVAAPAFSPDGGFYAANSIHVSITSTDHSAAIYYTTDGSTPSKTHGTLYQSSITLNQPSGTALSNASGNYKISAIAVDGTDTSDVTTEIFVVTASAPAGPSFSDSLQGIAHTAYNVTDIDKTRAFWTDFLGFEEIQATVGNNDFAVIKINDLQYVELYAVSSLHASQYQLNNFGYITTDAATLRSHYHSNGITVTAVSTNDLGNTSFEDTDTDGHVSEFVQYNNGSVTDLTHGQNMPGTQVLGSIVSNGGYTLNQQDVDDFYITDMGFLPNGSYGLSSHLVYVPNSVQFYEIGSLGPNQSLTVVTAGTKDQIDLLNFQGQTIQQTVDTLNARNPGNKYGVITCHVTQLGRTACNVNDPDGSRIEMDDVSTPSN